MALPQQLAEGDFRLAEKQKDQNPPREARDQSRAREKGGKSQEGVEDQEEPREAPEKAEPRAGEGNGKGREKPRAAPEKPEPRAESGGRERKTQEEDGDEE